MNESKNTAPERERETKTVPKLQPRGTNTIGRIYRFERRDRDRDDNNTQKTQIIKLC
jgi:hypothetical protein